MATGVSGDTAFGFYGSGEYQFARRWFAGRPLRSVGPAFDARSSTTAARSS